MTEQELSNAMRMHGDMVYRLALCRLQSVPDAEDVYQDVFLRYYGQQTTGWDGEHIKAWLIRCTLNRCADIGRSRSRILSLEDVPELAANPDPAAAEPWDAVARLPEDFRTPIHLYYGEGIPTGEIAALLHIPAATVRSRMHRARMQLKHLLGGSDDEEQLLEADPDHPRTRWAE